MPNLSDKGIINSEEKVRELLDFVEKKLLDGRSVESANTYFAFGLLKIAASDSKKNGLPVPTKELSRLGKKIYGICAKQQLTYAKYVLNEPAYEARAAAFDAGFSLKAADHYAKRAGIDISTESSEISKQIASKSLEKN